MTRLALPLALLMLLAADALAPPPVQAQCAGDCDGSGAVTVNELITAVTIALDLAPVERCAAADASGDGRVGIDELIAAVSQLLNGCGALVTVTGTCLVPGGSELVPCPPGTAVRCARCDDRGSCLAGADQTPLSAGTVGAAGRFALVLDARAVGDQPLIFAAELPGAIVYRLIDLGAAGVGGRAAGAAAGADVLIDPSAEGAARALATAGLERVADADVSALVDETRLAATRADAYADLDAGAAAAAAERLAFDALFLRIDAVAVSDDGRHAYVVDSSRDAIAALERRGDAWEAVQILRDGVDGADGLDGAIGVAVSPDGGSVVVAALDEDAIAIFAREAGSGRLSFVEREPLVDDFGPYSPIDVTVSPDGRHVYAIGFFTDVAVLRLDGAGLTPVRSGGAPAIQSVVVSPDGRNVYAAGEGAVVGATRDSQSGALSTLQTIALPGGEFAVASLALSPDGAFLYAGANETEAFEIPLAAPAGRAGGLDPLGGAVAVYRRDPATGELALVEVTRDGLTGAGALGTLAAVGVSPDGAHLYVGSAADGGVAVYARDRSGRLTLVQRRGRGGAPLGGLVALGGARSLALAPDGTALLLASGDDGGLAVSPRVPATGMLGAPAIARVVLLRSVALERPEAIVLSPDGAQLYVSSPALDAVSIFDRDADSGIPALRRVLRQGVGGTDGLSGATDLLASPDGRHLYVVGQLVDGDFIVGSSVAAYARGGGGLRLLGVERDGEAGAELGIVVAAALSPDGADLYLANLDGIARLRRDAASGRTRFADRFAFPGADFPAAIAVSPDGTRVYVVGDTSLLVFDRGADGALTFAEEVTANPAELLDGAAALALAPDGSHVYVVAAQGQSIVAFAREAGSDRLRQAAAVSEAPDLGRPLAVAISPDGRHVYVASDVDDAVVVFSRDAGGARLTRVGTARNGTDGVNGLGGANRLAVSPDGRHVYVGARADDALVTFARDAQTGRLEFVDVVR